MRLRRLKLVNFRGFEQLDLPLEDDLTVLVGINGSGKTSVLEAIGRVILLNLGLHIPPFTKRDQLVESRETEILVEASESDVAFEFRYRIPGGADIRKAKEWHERPTLFLYQVARNAVDETPGSTNPEQWEPVKALEGVGQPITNFSKLFHWFREREDLENEDRRSDPTHRDPQLEAVRRAIETTVPGYTNPRVRRPRFDRPGIYGAPEFVLDKGERTLGFAQFSTGERTIIALVADIARRMAIAHPGRPPLEQEAFVLIDEVELHLHPKWQAELPERLRKTFPKAQFILATHSPLVLSRVPSQCVRVLENFTLVQAGAPTEGRDPNALFTEVFDVPLRPLEVEHEIEAISELIDHENLGDARGRLQKLRERLGETDVDVTRLRTMLELLSA